MVLSSVVWMSSLRRQVRTRLKAQRHLGGEQVRGPEDKSAPGACDERPGDRVCVRLPRRSQEGVCQAGVCQAGVCQRAEPE